MKYYLVALMFVIMGAGARTMFEIAYEGMAKEHDFSPAKSTMMLIFLTLWYIGMMVFDVLLLTKKNLPAKNILIIFFSLGVFVPTIYMMLTH